ncbi:alpha/beta-hydrolase [Rhizoclosmatium globosum]|uniref:Alpha/beta-hydrolase n=1 Tax=Rhizoclosmatium globosum TaxID=329046 RepID=A0A1Y2BUW4_9FUNG|nr:alpha/beta-hydrolase [Rhizoclosmatium globosum]|eukprot:ORY38536.1 alpha/beta-hydrolase [Rhizoclosmatium globosum]
MAAFKCQLLSASSSRIPLLLFLALLCTVFLLLDSDTDFPGSLPSKLNDTVHIPQESIDYVKFSILPYAQSAFCPFSQLEQWNCTTCVKGSLGTTNITTFGGTAFKASGYTAFNPSTNTIIVAFRGSSTLDTWISDLLIAKPDYDLPAAPPGTKVHFGFLTLHSLGGALATIAAVDVFQHLADIISPSQIALLTFGQPRVGNPTFAAWVNSFHFTRSIRVTNQNDWTPHLPPHFSGFKHFTEEWWIVNDEGVTLECWDDNGIEEPDVSVAVVEQQGGIPVGWPWKRKPVREGREPQCRDRWNGMYTVSKHAWVWNEPIGFHVCLPVP